MRRRVFCASLADVFEDWPGPMADAAGRQLELYGDRANPDNVVVAASPGPAGFQYESPVRMHDIRQRLFALIGRTPHLDWLLLTKRAGNIAKMLPDSWGAGWAKHSPRCCTPVQT